MNNKMNSKLKNKNKINIEKNGIKKKKGVMT